MRPAATVPFTLAILVASANGHLGANSLDCQTLAKVFQTGSTQDLSQSIKDQIQDLLRKADPGLVQQAWKSAGGKGDSLLRLIQEAAIEGPPLPLLDALSVGRKKNAKGAMEASPKSETRPRRASTP